MTSAVQIADHSGIRELRLNRPEVHNAFDDRLIADLTAALKAAAGDPGVRVVVLTGVGASFSAGAGVNGAAYGGGVGLVACCDIAIGVDTAKFGLTEVKLGLVPAVISPYVIAA